MIKKREGFFQTFFIFAAASFLIIVIFKQDFSKGIRSKVEDLFVNLSGFSLFPRIDFFNLSSDVKKLEEENRRLLRNLVDQQILNRENKALKDQFKTTETENYTLIPVKVIGMPKFIPHVSLPEEFTINKGLKDKVKAGQAVIYKNMIIGKISRASYHISSVSLVTSPSSNLSVKTLSLGKDEKEALGIVKGKGNGELLLSDVILSEKLKIGDIVVTKGDLDSNGIGYPSDLIVGKIVSINKKPSDLFQSAKLKSVVDFSSLETVFVLSI